MARKKQANVEQNVFFQSGTLNEQESMKTQDIIEAEWYGMPEFIQEKKKWYKEIYVKCKTEKDLADFAELIGQQHLAKKTQVYKLATTFPLQEKRDLIRYRWIELDNNSLEPNTYEIVDEPIF